MRIIIQTVKISGDFKSQIKLNKPNEPCSEIKKLHTGEMINNPIS